MDILVLDDGIKGNFNQAYGIASSFPGVIEIETLRVSLKGPSYSLPGRKGTYPLSGKMLGLLCNFRLWRAAAGLLKKLLPGTEEVCRKKFNLVVSAGSVLAPVNLILAKKAGAESVHVMVPSLVPLNLFDHLVIPHHDYIRLKGRKRLKNLIVTMGAPNRITDDFLKGEKERLKNLIRIPEGKKTIGVIIGGDDQNYSIPVRFIQTLICALQTLDGRYNFLFTTSRRTHGKSVRFLQEKLEKDLKNVVYSEYPGYSESSYYPGMLALCDYILVTEDSINMISEAAGSGVPVIILGVERKNSRKLVFDFTLEKFTEKGYADYLPVSELDKLKEKLERTEGISFKKLNEAEECARKILKTLK